MRLATIGTKLTCNHQHWGSPLNARERRALQLIRSAMRALTIVALVAGAVMGTARAHEQSADDRTPPPASGDLGGRFTLTDHTGRTVTEAHFLGRPTLVYFGYTYCPDLCPLDAYNIAQAVKILDGRGVWLQPVFVTIDPARDTPARLQKWLAPIHPRFVGLTGTVEQIARAAEAYKVQFRRIETVDALDYTMVHPGLMYLMGPDGKFLLPVPTGTDATIIANAVADELAASEAGEGE